ncbi:MAG: quinol:electron acceptor oxidoreductase subunit ActD [Gemmataceae bacterium]
MNRQFLLGSFATDHDLVAATRAARDRHFPIVDAYTPYPVHGLDEALGLKPSRLGIVCFVCGLVGVVAAIAFQEWTMALDWPINVGGRPFNSWPAFVPVAFELLVLFAGFGVVFAFLGVSRMFPGKSARVMGPRVSNDQFVLVVEAREEAIDSAAVFALFREHHAVATEERAESDLAPAPARFSRRAANIALVVVLCAVVLLNWTLSGDHRRPNVEFMPEMTRAIPHESFAAHDALPHKMVLQPPPEGAIARGRLPLHFEANAKDAERAGEELHNPFTLGDKRWQARGAVVYETYCAMCHGPGGEGDGSVTKRGFPPPPSLLAKKKVAAADGTESEVEKYKDGQMFHIITFGKDNMAAYRAQVSPEDRWAVILHVRQLQKSKGAGK